MTPVSFDGPSNQIESTVRRPFQISSPSLLALAATATALTLAACDDSPTEIIDSFVKSGTVVATGSTSEPFDVADQSIVRVLAQSYDGTRADGTTIDPATIRLGVAVGAPATNSEGAATCNTTGGITILGLGGSASYFLESGSYCLLVLDTGSLATGSSVDYELLFELE